MIDKAQLFTGECINGNGEFEQDSPLADYVLYTLPRDLQLVREGTLTYDELAEKHRVILASIDHSVITTDDRYKASILQLDLVFIMGSYLPEGNFVRCPAEIIELAQANAKTHNLLPHMDYELVIDVNSREFEKTGRIRTFLGGDDGLSERDFYYGHYLSEIHIRNVASELKLLLLGQNTDHDAANATLANAASSMREFKEHMARYAKLSRDAFSRMRPYLASYPDGTRNASGAFMPSVQLAELALHQPSDEHLAYINESIPYFPLWAREIMEECMHDSLNGNNVMSLIENGKLELNNEGMTAFNQLLESFYRFRTIHLGITKKQIPEAFNGADVPASRRQFTEFGEPDIMAGGTPGTAGFNVINILGGSTSRLARLQDRVDQRREA